MNSLESLQHQLQDDIERRRQEAAVAITRAQVTHREADERRRAKEQEFSDTVLRAASYISNSMLERQLYPTHSLTVWTHQIRHSFVLGNRSSVSTVHICDGWLLPEDGKKRDSKLLLGVGGLLFTYSSKYSRVNQAVSPETGRIINSIVTDSGVPISRIQVPGDMPLQIDRPIIERSLVQFATEHNILLTGH